MTTIHDIANAVALATGFSPELSLKATLEGAHELTQNPNLHANDDLSENTAAELFTLVTKAAEAALREYAAFQAAMQAAEQAGANIATYIWILRDDT